MRSFERVLKVTAMVAAVVLIIGLSGVFVGIGKVVDGDYGILGLEKDKIKSISKKDPITNTYNIEDVKNLSISGSLGELIIKENPDSKTIKVYTTHKDDTKMEIENGTLNIITSKESIKKRFSGIAKFIGLNNYQRDITVEVPSGVKLENVNADLSFGDINISSINCKNLRIDSRFGEVNVDLREYTLIGSLVVDTSYGETEIKNLDALTMDISSSKGSTDIYLDNKVNSAMNKMDIKNSMGDIEIVMGNIDRNINISNNMGDVELVSKNHISKDVKVSIKESLGSGNNNFKYDDSKLNKSVEVNIDVDMGSVELSH